MEAKHTATPWYCDINDDESMVYIQDESHRFSLRLEMNGSLMPRFVGKKKELREELEANARFIVRACNAHDDQVKALQAVLPYVNAGEALIIRAALAKAEA